MKDLSCWDCAMYALQCGVRCARHRSEREEAKLRTALRSNSDLARKPPTDTKNPPAT